MALQPESLRLQGDRTAAGKRVVKAGQLLRVEQFLRLGWFLLSSQVSRHERRISARARSSTASLFVFSHCTRSSMILKRRPRFQRRLSPCYGPSGVRPAGPPGSWTICANITARAAASGRRAHH